MRRLAFLLLGITYSIVTPIFEASDELWHYPLVQWLSKGNPLPVQDAKNVGLWKQEASQPPLYYWLTGWATFWIDTSDMAQVRQENPHADNGVITPDGNRNLVVHQPQHEAFPWSGTALAVHLVRLLSVLMGAATVWLTYRIALELFPDRQWLALGAAAVNAFTPMFIFISGAVNNDNLTMLLCSLGLLLIVKRVREYEGIGIRDQRAAEREVPFARDFFYRVGRWLPLGVVLGVGALTKTSALALVPITGLAVGVVAWRKGSWREFWAGACATAIPVLLIAGWWYLRNVQLYGDVTGINAFIDVLGRRATPASLLQLWGERWGFMLSYWGLFGGVNVPLDNWVYHVLNGLAILAIVGVIIYFVTVTWQWFRADPIHSWRDFRYELRDYVQGRAALFLVGLFGVIVVALLTQWARVTWSSQGRLVFSAISTWSIYFVLGLATVATKRLAKPFIALVGVFMFLVSALAPFTTIAPAYAQPAPLAAATPQILLNVTFGDQFKLLGADVASASAQPGGHSEVTLYWQALKPNGKDYSTFVHLLDANDIVVAQRDMYPGQGLWPTSQMKPGDIIASRYVLNIPAAAYAPDQLKWEVGMYDFATQQRLPVSSGGDNSRFGSVGLASQLVGSSQVPNPTSVNLENQIELVGYALDRRAASPDEAIFLTLYWQAKSRLPADYTVFTHILQPPETIWAQQDKPLQPPSSSWPIGQVVSDTYELKIKPDAPPGVYDIEVGVYDPQRNFERLRVVTDDGRITDNFVLLSKVRIK